MNENALSVHIHLFAVGTADILRVARQMEASVANDHELHILRMGQSFIRLFDVFHQHRGLYQRAIDDILSPAEKVVSDLVDCNQSDSIGVFQVFQFRN